MEDSNKSDSAYDENHYLNMIISSSIKKIKSANKEKLSKSNYKLNLLDDLMDDNGNLFL